MSFKADEYVPGETPHAKPEWVGTRTRDETNDACPRHEEVRSRTNDAADRVRREGNYWTAQQYGTAVHKDLEGQIRALKDPNFRAEVSISKTKNENYGTPGSIRIDVLENVGNGAGFSDVGMMALPRALADVGEAPRHEVAGVGLRRCRKLYGDLPLGQVRAVIAAEDRRAFPATGDGASCGAGGTGGGT